MTKITTEVTDTSAPIYITRNELDHLIEKTVESTLIKVGIDPKDPIKFQLNMAYVTQLREGSSATRLAVMATFLAGAATVIGTVLWLGIQALIHGKTPG